MSEEEELKSVVSLIRGVYQDLAIDELSESLKKTRSDFGPMPGAVHPALSGHAEFVRELNKEYVCLPQIRNSRYDFSSPETIAPVATEHLRLIRRKAFGLAPYVGEEFVYVWYFWADDYGRHIAQDYDRVERRMRYSEDRSRA